MIDMDESQPVTTVSHMRGFPAAPVHKAPRIGEYHDQRSYH